VECEAYSSGALCPLPYAPCFGLFNFFNFFNHLNDPNEKKDSLTSTGKYGKIGLKFKQIKIESSNISKTAYQILI
jgi:hypothetical protein